MSLAGRFNARDEVLASPRRVATIEFGPVSPSLRDVNISLTVPGLEEPVSKAGLNSNRRYASKD